MIYREKAVIRIQREISAGIFDLTLEAPQIAGAAVPGQFVNVYLNDAARLLPRPISLCGIDREGGTLRLVYRTSGAGTAELSQMTEGEELYVMGPLGNGFPLEEARGRRVFLIGGGIGVPPLLETARQLGSARNIRSEIENTENRNLKVISVLGYRHDQFLRDDFEKVSEPIIATEDGSAGVKGTVIDAMNADGRIPDVIFACGPKPMLRALKSWAAERNIPLWVSMEERMACGVGACLGCVCETVKEDAHSHVHNARVCKDGPVFNAADIVL